MSNPLHVRISRQWQDVPGNVSTLVRETKTQYVYHHRNAPNTYISKPPTFLCTTGWAWFVDTRRNYQLQVDGNRQLGRAWCCGSPQHRRLVRATTLTHALRRCCRLELAGELAGTADRLALFPRRLLRRLLVEPAPLHLPEYAFALHLFLQDAERLIDIVVANEHMQICLSFCRFMTGSTVHRNNARSKSCGADFIPVADTDRDRRSTQSSIDRLASAPGPVHPVDGIPYRSCLRNIPREGGVFGLHLPVSAIWA
jgi:hypothetical protein